MAQLQGPATAFPGSTSDIYTTPFPISPGTRARDASGNEYVFCDFDAAVYPEIVVAIDPDFTAAVPAVGAVNGPLGVVTHFLGMNDVSTATAPASGTTDQGGWVQIYGRAFVQVGANAASPSDAANGPTTARTSAATLFYLPTSATTPAGVLGTVSAPPETTTDSRWIAEGITVAVDVSLGEVSVVAPVSATHYGSRCAVFLNYPEAVFHEDGDAAS